MNASCIIAGTNDDAINLSIVATARALKPDIFVIVRENELEERSLFSHLRADKIFMIDQIAALDAYNYIDRPMTYDFIDTISFFEKEKLIDTLQHITNRVNKRPDLLELAVNPNTMYALCDFLTHTPVTLGQIINNPYHNGIDLEIAVLGIKRKDGKFILMPEDKTPLQLNDHLLIATIQPSLKSFMTIVNHHHELYYVLHGVEEKTIYIPFTKRKIAL